MSDLLRTTAEPLGEPEVIIEAREVSKTFSTSSATITAVADVSLQVHRGETVGLVGESGSGKSTLARLILGLIPLTRGSISVNGISVSQLSGELRHQFRAQLQAVFQNATGSLLPHYSALDNVIEPMIIHKVGTPRQRTVKAREMLDLVGIDPRLGINYPRQFSGGQQQRIAIARALVLDPAVLICDEPTSALDVSVQAQVLALFQRLRNELELTCVFISHNLGVIEKVSDRVAVMRNGHIVELAPTTALFNQPSHPYTRQLLNAVLPVRGEDVKFDRWSMVPAEEEGSTLAELVPGHFVRQPVLSRPDACRSGPHPTVTEAVQQ